MGVVGPSQRNLRRWGMLGNSNKTNDNPISSTKEVIKPSIENLCQRRIIVWNAKK